MYYTEVINWFRGSNRNIDRYTDNSAIRAQVSFSIDHLPSYAMTIRKPLPSSYQKTILKFKFIAFLTWFF